MSVRFNESSIPGRHTIRYRLLDSDRGNPTRQVEVLATEAEIDALVKDGYLVRRQLLPPDEIERLRAALDALADKERYPTPEGSRSFGGVFVRHLADKHPAFLEMINFPPTASAS